MFGGRGISQTAIVLGIVVIIVTASTVIYFVQPGIRRATMQQTQASLGGFHEGTIDLSVLPVHNTPGGNYYVIPLNLTINYNFSLYYNKGAEFAIPEYVVLNYSWTSASVSFASTVQLGIIIGGDFCSATSDHGSIYGVVSHIVTMLAKATSTSAVFTGSFTYSYVLLKVPMVTTIINNGEPNAIPVRTGPPYGLCIPGTQVVRPIFTYPLRAPTISGYKFQGWMGQGPGSYSGPSGNITITVTGNVTESAEYA